jgi:hypothetical protein
MAAPSQDELAALDYIGPVEASAQAQASTSPDPLSELEYLSPLDARENPPLVAVDRTGAPLDPAKAGFAPEGTDPLSPANRWNEKSAPYKVTSGGIELDPLRYGAGVQSAYAAGLIDQATFSKLSSNAAKIEETARRRRDLEATAGSSPEGKALLYGAGRGGAVTMGFLGGAAIPAVAGMAAGPAALATGTAGGIVGGYAAGRGYDALYKTLAENDSEFSSYLAASEARPGYNAAGELASIAITAPAAPYNLIKGIQLVRETKGALEAAKFAGKVVGLGAGTGAATDITWRLADQALASGDETPEGPTFQSSFQSAVMGALLSGLTVQNKRYEMGDIQALVSKKQAGESLSPMDEEAVSTALRVTDAVRGEYGPTARGNMRMQGTSFMGKPEALKTEVALGEGVEGRGSRVEGLPAGPGAPADLGELIPIEDAPSGAFTMDRNNAVPANTPEGVIAMPGRPALADGNLKPAVTDAKQRPGKQTGNLSQPSAPASTPAPADDLAELEPITGYTDPETTGGIPIPYTESKLKISDIKLSEDVPNFKENANPDTGVVRGQEIQGNIDMRAFGHLMIWQRNNGANELISGRHRFDAAKRNRLDTVPAYVMREADGFTKPMAMALDAELNILDEKGEVKDYANYFRNTTITEDKAAQRGLLSRAKGRSGFRIGTGAGPDLYAAYQAGRINEARTLAIATAAPGDVDLQRAGIAAALRKVPADEITGLLGYIKVAKNLEAQGTQGDLFGTSDAALQKGEEIAKAAAAKVREINEQIAAVQSAAKRPEAAAKLGVNVKDPEGILNRVAELQQLAARYKSFYTDPEIMAELSGVSPEQAAAEMAPPAPATPNIATNGEGNLFAPADMPFGLTGEVMAEPTPAEIAEAERQRLAQEEADRAQGDMFSGGFSGTADYGPQGGSRGAPAADPSIPKEATVMSRGPGWEMPEVLGATDRVLPIEAPELIRWFREATGMSPEVRRRMKSLGLFYPVGKGRIALRASLFSNPQSVAMTLAHEIGHWIDYLPDESLKRGNILGRLATLSKFKSNLLPEIGGSNKEIRAELIALSDWWKPFGAETASKKSSYYKYRVSAVELYADAISVLFNSPADLEVRAPKFWKAFFDLVDRKPEVAEAIAAIQTFLAKGPEAVNRTRLAESKAGYAKASELVKRRSAAMKAWAKSPRRLWERAKDTYYFYAQPAIELMHQKRRSGQPLKPEDRMDWLFEEMPLANSSVQADLMEITAKVSPILQEVGLTDDDLGIYLENYRIANERIEVERQVGKASEQESEIEVTGRTVMANPDGKDPVIAQALLDQQRADMSPEQWAALQQAAEAFHDKIFSVLSEAVDAGIISREIYETLLVPNKDAYATFTPLKYADRYVPAGIVKQVGTLDQVANPYTQSVLKMAAMRRAAQSNQAKATFFNWMKENFSGLIQDAEMRWDGRRNVPVPTREVGWKTLTYRVDGKLRGVHLPERYADVFESMSPAHQDGLMQALSFLWSSAAYPLIIKYNPSFQLALSPMRDLLRTMRNAPDKTRGRILGQTAYQLGLAMLQPQGREALATTAGGVVGTAVGSTIGFVGGPAAAVAAGQVGSYVGSAIGMALGKMLAAIPVNIGSSPLVNRISGQADDLLIEMLQNGAMVGPHESFYATADSHGALGDILRQYNMLPAEDQPAWSRKWFVKPVLSYLRSIQFAGQIMEALPKVSAYKVLAKDLGWPTREAAAYVRNYMGVPNYMKKGNGISTPGILFPFINITMRSWESSMKLLAGREKGRKSQADYLLSYLFFGGFLTTVMTVLAREGFFGDDMAGIFRKIPDRDVYAYHSIPVGTTTTGDYGSKTAYFRWPVDEVDRAINGMVYYGLTSTLRQLKGEKTGIGLGQIMAVPQGELPSLNPFLSLPAKWATYAAGMNPIDEHRGRSILTDDELKAGGWPAAKKMVIHSLDKMGVSNFLRYDEKSNTVSEFAVSSTAPINRFLKITDAGESERDRDEVAGEEKAIAQVRVDLSEDVRTATREYSWLQKLAEKRTPQQTLRFAVLKQWNSQIYRPQIEAMRSAVEKGDVAAGARAVRTINGITDGMKSAWAKSR